MGYIWRIIEKANWYSFVCGAVMFFILIFIISAESVARYIFAYSIGWGFEVTSYVLVASTFLCLGYILSIDSHLKITLFVDMLNKKQRARVNIVVLILTLLCAVTMLWASLPLAWESYQSGARSESAYGLLLWPYMVTVPFGCVMFLLQSIAEIRKNILLLV